MAKAIVKKTSKTCWCAGCMAPNNGGVEVNFDGPYDRKPYCLCEDCFAELVKSMVAVATDMRVICSKVDDVNKWNGLKDKRIDCPTISDDEINSGNWIPRAVVVETFNVGRSTLDRKRRCGEIQARKNVGTETQREGYCNSYPQAGYLYNVQELEEKFGKKN